MTLLSILPPSVIITLATIVFVLFGIYYWHYLSTANKISKIMIVVCFLGLVAIAIFGAWDSGNTSPETEYEVSSKVFPRKDFYELQTTIYKNKQYTILPTTTCFVLARKLNSLDSLDSYKVLDSLQCLKLLATFRNAKADINIPDNFDPYVTNSAELEALHKQESQYVSEETFVTRQKVLVSGFALALGFLALIISVKSLRRNFK
jgi:hypothetical protein